MTSPKYHTENQMQDSGLIQSLGIAIPVSITMWVGIILLLF